MDLVVKEQIEIDFWKNSIYENPDIFTIPNIVYKLSEAKIFLKKIEKYKNYISNSLTVLEVGAGQGWASCKPNRRAVYRNRRNMDSWRYCRDCATFNRASNWKLI